ASGTAPRTIVSSPFETPNSSVKASAVPKLLDPSSIANERGKTTIEIRPRFIGSRFLPNAISARRPATCANPFIEASVTAAVRPTPDASIKGTYRKRTEDEGADRQHKPKQRHCEDVGAPCEDGLCAARCHAAESGVEAGAFSAPQSPRVERHADDKI